MAQQRLRMSDIFPDPNEDESPLALDEAARALYRRAIDNPSSLTDEERRTVTPRPEEDELCRQILRPGSEIGFGRLPRDLCNFELIQYFLRHT
ncbi:hypothetical protein N7444_006292 [Penicillium canescens]|nr:hypothetical protein N7444_006292 [Penicillium canescens]